MSPRCLRRVLRASLQGRAVTSSSHCRCALLQASLQDRNDLRDVIAAVQKVPKHFRNLGRIRLSLAPFESRTEVIDGVPWAPLRLRHQEETVQLRLQLQLMRVLREMGVYDSDEVFRAVAVEAVREHTTLVAIFFRELCQEVRPPPPPRLRAPVPPSRSPATPPRGRTCPSCATVVCNGHM